MLTRHLGNSDLELTLVGLGTWAIGGPWQFGWGPQNDDDSVNAILEALENGINWIDTAAIYGCGHSEEIIGKTIKEFGQRPIIATKCSLLWNEKREKISCLKADSIIAECEESLKRLGIDVIDLYQMHWAEPDEDIEEGWAAMAELVKQGKVRYIGASNISIPQLERLSVIYPVVSLQPSYSMLGREFEQEALPYCKQNNIGVVCYSPMHRGLLTGKFDAQKIAALPEGDHRKMGSAFNEPALSINLKLVDGLKPIAQRNNITLAQLAVAWTIRLETVTSAIVGARKKGQITETVKAADFKLSQDDINDIETLLAQRENELH
jgi:aryl-alcohol dehydrogenase-like predicted oxidoreductase